MFKEKTEQQVQSFSTRDVNKKHNLQSYQKSYFCQ